MRQFAYFNLRFGWTDGRVPGTHNLIRVVLAFWAAFLRLENSTNQLLQTPNERLVAKRPTGAPVPAKVP
jgi:hypothetical protein